MSYPSVYTQIQDIINKRDFKWGEKDVFSPQLLYHLNGEDGENGFNNLILILTPTERMNLQNNVLILYKEAVLHQATTRIEGGMSKSVIQTIVNNINSLIKTASERHSWQWTGPHLTRSLSMSNSSSTDPSSLASQLTQPPSHPPSASSSSSIIDPNDLSISSVSSIDSNNPLYNEMIQLQNRLYAIPGEGAQRKKSKSQKKTKKTQKKTKKTQKKTKKTQKKTKKTQKNKITRRKKKKITRRKKKKRNRRKKKSFLKRGRIWKERKRISKIRGDKDLMALRKKQFYY